MAATLQFTFNAPIAIARKLVVNVFDLLAQLLIFGFAPAMVLCVRLVVIAAGWQTRYLAGFRNWSKFLAVITDVSAFFFR